MLYHRSFSNRRDGGPRNSGDHGIRYTLLRRRYAKMTMYMYAARFGPNRPHARADAERALDGFFDSIEEKMTRLPRFIDGADWDNRRKQLLSK